MAQRQFRDTFIEVNRAVVTVDFASVAANGNLAGAAVTVTGAALGDIVLVSPVTAPASSFTFTGFVSAANTVIPVAHNATAGAVDLASQNFNVVVLRPKF